MARHTGPTAGPQEARIELSEEQRVVRSSRPKKRRWRELDKRDAEVDRLAQKLAEASARVGEAEAAVHRAPQDDAESLAAWIAAGEKGERPKPTLYERQRNVDAARLLVDAVQRELDRALARRVDHVVKHRGRMLADAREDVDGARRRYLQKVNELAPLREELLASRENLTWVGAFPDRMENWGFPTATALGLQEPVRRTLNTKARIEYTALLALLAEDATALAEAFSDEQKRQLGADVPRTPLREAMWDGDPDNEAWKRQELERARQLAQFGNVHQLAQEVREQRPLS